MVCGKEAQARFVAAEVVNQIMLLRCKNVVLYSPDPPRLKGEGGGSGYETRHYLTVRNFCLTISRMSLGHRGPWTDPSRLINICTRTKHTYCYTHTLLHSHILTHTHCYTHIFHNLHAHKHIHTLPHTNSMCFTYPHTVTHTHSYTHTYFTIYTHRVIIQQ